MARLSLPAIGGFEFGERDAAGDVPWRLRVAKLDVPHPLPPNGARAGRELVLTSDSVGRFGVGIQGKPVRINPRADDHWDDAAQKSAGVKARAFGYVTHSGIERGDDGGKYWVLAGHLWRHEDPRVTDWVLANAGELGGSYEIGAVRMRPEGATDYIEEFAPQGVAILKQSAAAFQGLTSLVFASVDLRPTEEMARLARRGLELRKKYGRGATAVGVARARDIANRKNLSPETIGRMVNFFGRHRKNLNAPAARRGHPEYPSPGVIAWLVWGGDPADPEGAGAAWARERYERLQAVDASLAASLCGEEGEEMAEGMEPGDARWCDVCEGEGDCPLGEDCPLAMDGGKCGGDEDAMDSAGCRAKDQAASTPGELEQPRWVKGKKIVPDASASADTGPGGDSGAGDPLHAGGPKGEPMDENTTQLIASQAAEIGELKAKLAAAEAKAAEVAAAAEADRGALEASAADERAALEAKLTGDAEVLAAKVVELEQKIEAHAGELAAAAEKTATLEAERIAATLNAAGNEAVKAVCLKLARGEALSVDEGLLLASARRDEAPVMVPELGASADQGTRKDRVDAMVAAMRSARDERSQAKVWQTVDAAAKGA